MLYARIPTGVEPIAIILDRRHVTVLGRFNTEGKFLIILGLLFHEREAAVAISRKVEWGDLNAHAAVQALISYVELAEDVVRPATLEIT